MKRITAIRHFKRSESGGRRPGGDTGRHALQYDLPRRPPTDRDVATPRFALRRRVPTMTSPAQLRDLAPLLLRLFVAFVLVYGTQDNVFSHERMLEFRDFLAANGFPAPLAAARLSAWAQFTTGILLFVGLFTRLAAAVVVVNFVVALLMVHLRLPFTANIAPLAMFVGGLFFVLHGAPRYSFDAVRDRRKRSAENPPAPA